MRIPGTCKSDSVKVPVLGYGETGSDVTHRPMS